VKLRGKPIEALRPLPGDVYSQALGINEWRQVVGLSCSAGFASCRAFLWQNGVTTDLNDVVPPGYADHLYAANDINDFGQITGEAIEHGTGASVPFKASPLLLSFHATRPGGDAHVELPEPVRLKLMARFGIRDADLAR
jgi:probable HAF family extracellular repeat protein